MTLKHILKNQSPIRPLLGAFARLIDLTTLDLFSQWEELE